MRAPANPQAGTASLAGAKPYKLNEFFGAWPDNDNSYLAFARPLTDHAKPQHTRPIGFVSEATHPEGIGRM
jgi:hypothetical protein